MNYNNILMQMEKNDPEYYSFFKRFETIVNDETDIDEKSRYLGIIGALISSKNVDFFPIILEKALEHEVTPNEIKEVLYEAAYIIGIANVFPFITLANEFFKSKNIQLPLENQCKVTPEEALQKGIQKQAEAFGKGMENFHKIGPMQRWVTNFMYGEFYTREVLSVKQRELILACIFIAYGDSTAQLLQHIKANLHVGNDKKVLVQMIFSLVPYIGYPRTFNALRTVNQATNKGFLLSILFYFSRYIMN